MADVNPWSQVLKMVRAVIDSSTTVVCLHANGQIRAYGEKFQTLAGDYDAPPFHRHCRSTLVPYVGGGQALEMRREANAELARRPRKRRRLGPNGEVGGYVPPPPDPGLPLSISPDWFGPDGLAAQADVDAAMAFKAKVDALVFSGTPLGEALQLEAVAALSAGGDVPGGVLLDLAQRNDTFRQAYEARLLKLSEDAVTAGGAANVEVARASVALQEQAARDVMAAFAEGPANLAKFTYSPVTDLDPLPKNWLVGGPNQPPHIPTTPSDVWQPGMQRTRDVREAFTFDTPSGKVHSTKATFGDLVDNSDPFATTAPSVLNGVEYRHLNTALRSGAPLTPEQEALAGQLRKVIQKAELSEDTVLWRAVVVDDQGVWAGSVKQKGKAYVERGFTTWTGTPQEAVDIATDVLGGANGHIILQRALLPKGTQMHPASLSDLALGDGHAFRVVGGRIAGHADGTPLAIVDLVLDDGVAGKLASGDVKEALLFPKPPKPPKLAKKIPAKVVPGDHVVIEGYQGEVVSVTGPPGNGHPYKFEIVNDQGDTVVVTVKTSGQVDTISKLHVDKIWKSPADLKEGDYVPGLGKVVGTYSKGYGPSFPVKIQPPGGNPTVKWLSKKSKLPIAEPPPGAYLKEGEKLLGMVNQGEWIDIGGAKLQVETIDFVEEAEHKVSVKFAGEADNKILDSHLVVSKADPPPVLPDFLTPSPKAVQVAQSYGLPDPDVVEWQTGDVVLWKDQPQLIKGKVGDKVLFEAPDGVVTTIDEEAIPQFLTKMGGPDEWIAKVKAPPKVHITTPPLDWQQMPAGSVKQGDVMKLTNGEQAKVLGTTHSGPSVTLKLEKGDGSIFTTTTGSKINVKVWGQASTAGTDSLVTPSAVGEAKKLGAALAPGDKFTIAKKDLFGGKTKVKDGDVVTVVSTKFQHGKVDLEVLKADGSVVKVIVEKAGTFTVGTGPAAAPKAVTGAVKVLQVTTIEKLEVGDVYKFASATGKSTSGEFEIVTLDEAGSVKKALVRDKATGKEKWVELYASPPTSVTVVQKDAGKHAEYVAAQAKKATPKVVPKTNTPASAGANTAVKAKAGAPLTPTADDGLLQTYQQLQAQAKANGWYTYSGPIDLPSGARIHPPRPGQDFEAWLVANAEDLKHLTRADVDALYALRNMSMADLAAAGYKVDQDEVWRIVRDQQPLSPEARRYGSSYKSSSSGYTGQFRKGVPEASMSAEHRKWTAAFDKAFRANANKKHPPLVLWRGVGKVSSEPFGNGLFGAEYIDMAVTGTSTARHTAENFGQKGSGALIRFLVPEDWPIWALDERTGGPHLGEREVLFNRQTRFRVIDEVEENGWRVFTVTPVPPPPVH